MEFKEQLPWFLAGTESTDKPDAAKIEFMLSHAGRDTGSLQNSSMVSRRR